jgi:hypothetical protein
MANAFTSYKEKLVDFGFKAGSFKNDTGETVDFKQVVIKVEIDGDIEELVISGASAPKPNLLNTILKGAKSHDPTVQGFLGSDTK